MKVPDSDWYLIAKVDSTEIFASLNEKFISIALFIWLLIITAGGAVFSIWRHNILIVEDDKVNARVLSRYLSSSCKTDIASTGKEAIEKAKNIIYNAILMDIGLRGELSGLDAAKAIRQIKGYENTPIVAVTAYAMHGDKERFLAGGCTHCLAKPFTQQQLLILIREIV